jgi:HK97 gp10 family phage protein
MAEHVSIHGLDKTVAALRALPVAISGKNGGPLRGALFAATRLIRDEAIARAPIGKSTVKPGNLRRNIFAYRDPNPRASTGAAERFIISVRTGRKGTRRFRVGGGTRVLTGGDAWYWFWVEFGTSKMPARPFMRPAFESQKRRALIVFGRELRVGVQKAVARVKKGKVT